MPGVLLAAVVTLAFAGSAAAVIPTSVLPRPGFPAAASSGGTGSVHFTVVSSVPIDPALPVKAPKPPGLKIDGEDGNTQRYVLGPSFTFDFRNYATPPRIAPGEREFTYEQML